LPTAPPPSPTRLNPFAAAAAGYGPASSPPERLYPTAAAAGYGPVSSPPARLYPTAAAAAGYGPAVRGTCFFASSSGGTLSILSSMLSIFLEEFSE